MKVLLYANSPEKADRVLAWERALAGAFPIEPVVHLPAEPEPAERAAADRLSAELAAGGSADPGTTGQPSPPAARTVEESIAAEAARGDYPLVVLAPAGRKGVVRLLFGSMVGQVVRRVKSSVLVVRGGAVPPRRLLVCVSGSRHSLTNVRMAARLAAAFEARVTLLMVISQLPVQFAGRQDAGLTRDFLQSDHPLAAHMRAADELLRRMGAGERSAIHVREGLVVEEILDEVESAGHDVVLIGTHQAEDYDPMYEDLTSELISRLSRTALVVGLRADLP